MAAGAWTNSFQRGRTVGGGAHHLDVGLLLEDVGEAVPDELRVVHDEYADHSMVPFI